MNIPNFFLGFESVRAGNGGVCRVARLMAQVLAAEQAAGRCRVGGVVLSDPGPSPELGLDLQYAKGSRAKYVLAVNAALFRHTHFIYDCGGMARSHQWFLFPRRPNLVFQMGIEAWPGTCHPKQVEALLRANRRVAITAYTRSRAGELDPSLANAELCWLATEAEMAPAPMAPAARPNVMILARLDRYKGHEELIRCWPNVLAAVPNALLTIVGSGPSSAEFRKMAGEMGLTDQQVEFAGFVPEDRIDAYWRKATVFAMPSRGEGFGLVYIEAMRYGLPVIGSIHDAAVEVNINGVTGYNISLDRPDELTERIIRLFRDPVLAARLGANGVARWNEHFRFSAFRERFLTILRRWVGEEIPFSSAGPRLAN